MGVIAGRETPASNVVPTGVLPGIAVLLQAHKYAASLARSAWDFALEIRELRSEGLTSSDLRWLVCAEYVEHGREITIPGENERKFQRTALLTFSKRTCFVLTESGVAAAEQVLSEAKTYDPSIDRFHSGNGRKHRFAAAGTPSDTDPIEVARGENPPPVEAHVGL